MAFHILNTFFIYALQDGVTEEMVPHMAFIAAAASMNALEEVSNQL